jgi:hypothetical protein
LSCMVLIPSLASLRSSSIFDWIWLIPGENIILSWFITDFLTSCCAYVLTIGIEILSQMSSKKKTHPGVAFSCKEAERLAL